MNIKVVESNMEKIEAAIKQAEGRAKVRTIAARDIMEAVSEVENHYGISKKAMIGIRVVVDVNAQDFPNAYKYIPESTHFMIERKSSGWFVVDIRRDRCKAPSLRYVLTSRLSDEQKAAILQRFTAWA